MLLILWKIWLILWWNITKILLKYEDFQNIVSKCDKVITKIRFFWHVKKQKSSCFASRGTLTFQIRTWLSKTRTWLSNTQSWQPGPRTWHHAPSRTFWRMMPTLLSYYFLTHSLTTHLFFYFWVCTFQERCRHKKKCPRNVKWQRKSGSKHNTRLKYEDWLPRDPHKRTHS